MKISKHAIFLATSLFIASTGKAEPVHKTDNSWFYAPEVLIAGIHLNMSYIQKVYIDGVNLHIYTQDNHFVEPYASAAEVKIGYDDVKTKILERVCAVIVTNKNKQETLYPWPAVQSFATETDKIWIQRALSNTQNEIESYEQGTAVKVCL